MLSHFFVDVACPRVGVFLHLRLFASKSPSFVRQLAIGCRRRSGCASLAILFIAKVFVRAPFSDSVTGYEVQLRVHLLLCTGLKRSV